ncbi:hypothetical protein [Phenylobacterium sp.]|uniref:hypothetical protein n=1 Tax=Phenylobacterium sp. TaxID=1871053 RepID=UPI002810D276|nr:hypothetical protein [Phenylobacterium sp.]
MRAASAMLTAALALGGCVTSFEGERPSSLYGQHTDAAVALYGPWDEAVTLEGKRYYIWRRQAETAQGVRVCELRLEITPRHLIARRLVRGYPEACDLFTARFVPDKR